MTMTNKFLRVQIAIPQDHGSWVFILSPLIIGLFAGGRFTTSSLVFAATAMTAFLIRQPVTMAVKAYSGRRSREDLPAARFWLIIYGLILTFSIAELIALKQTYVLFLGIPAIPIFAWHLYLVSRRLERRQAGVEILAIGVLSLVAPAAYWIGHGGYEPNGWILWILIWCQSAASILYAYLRLEQRRWKSLPSINDRFGTASPALGFVIFNLVLTFFLGTFKVIPGLVWLSFLLQTIETIWGTLNPAIGVKPVAVGVRQLVVTILFTLIFILTWR